MKLKVDKSKRWAYKEGSEEILSFCAIYQNRIKNIMKTVSRSNTEFEVIFRH